MPVPRGLVKAKVSIPYYEIDIEVDGYYFHAVPNVFIHKAMVGGGWNLTEKRSGETIHGFMRNFRTLKAASDCVMEFKRELRIVMDNVIETHGDRRTRSSYFYISEVGVLQNGGFKYTDLLKLIHIRASQSQAGEKIEFDQSEFARIQSTLYGQADLESKGIES